jgi:hypothetical protein
MNLRARTIETMGYMISAVEDDEEKVLLPVVKQVTERLFVLLQSEFSHEDPQEPAVKEALSKIAFYLKEDFNLVAPKFLEILIKDASVNVDIKSENADLPSTQQDNKSKSFEFKLKGMENSTRISVNTSALGNKIQAFQLILKLSEAMSYGFAPYIETVLPVLKDNINHFSKEIRKAALKTYRFILSDIHEPENLKFFR